MPMYIKCENDPAWSAISANDHYDIKTNHVWFWAIALTLCYSVYRKSFLKRVSSGQIDLFFEIVTPFQGVQSGKVLVPTDHLHVIDNVHSSVYARDRSASSAQGHKNLNTQLLSCKWELHIQGIVEYTRFGLRAVHLACWQVCGALDPKQPCSVANCWWNIPYARHCSNHVYLLLFLFTFRPT